MNPIIEKVARAMEDVGSMSSYASKGLLREARARAAIRATLEHLRDNVSEGMRTTMAEKLHLNGYDRLYENEHAEGALKAVFSAAIAELDAKGGDAM
jgi:uncharacterized protein (DUF2267 family)